MKFGHVAVRDAVGAVLAHSLQLPDGVMKKGRMLSAADCEALAAQGRSHVMVAQLEAGDLAEDVVAARVAAIVAGPGLTIAPAFTGRCNLFAKVAGVVQVDPARLIALNAIDEAITLATLAPFARVVPGQMVATVKLITFAAAAMSVAAIETEGRRQDRPLVDIAPFRPRRAGLIITTLPGQKASVLAKREIAVRDRLERLGSSLEQVDTVPHEIAAVAAAIASQQLRAYDLILVFGASAIVDRGDVVPVGLVGAGGTVEHLGMPVDPGNLLMLGRLGQTPVVGVPSCAASPKENGFDWVLERLCAGLALTRRDIVGMAPGGLLMEIETRPQPRQPDLSRVGA